MKKSVLVVFIFVFALSQFLVQYSAADASSNCKVLEPYYVSQVQQGLKNKGYNPGTIDGRMGPNTCSAIIKFQKAKKLTADGIVGSNTGNALGLSRIISCGSGYTTCFLAVERTGYQGHTYVIKNGKVLKKLQSTFGKRIVDSRGRITSESTPTGKYTIFRSIAGAHTSSQYPSEEPNMYYPMYFKGGFAIHGSKSVGSSSGSHGCVRIPWNSARDLHNTYYKQQGIKTVIVRR